MALLFYAAKLSTFFVSLRSLLCFVTGFEYVRFFIATSRFLGCTNNLMHVAICAKVTLVYTKTVDSVVDAL